MCFTDAYDVLCVANPAAILATYRAFGREIVFSGEKYCHPDDTDLLKSEYERVQGPSDAKRYPFLNAGGFVGTCGELRACLAAFPSYTETEDDQRHWTSVYLSQRFDIGIDFDAKIFVCMVGTPPVTCLPILLAFFIPLPC
jgi:hypothetical protein